MASQEGGSVVSHSWGLYVQSVVSCYCLYLPSYLRVKLSRIGNASIRNVECKAWALTKLDPSGFFVQDSGG